MRMLRRILGGGIVALAATLVVQAQAPARPDFSGAWTIVHLAGEHDAEMGGLGDKLTIEQNATSITLVRDLKTTTFTSAGKDGPRLVPHRFTYPFDGAETHEWGECEVTKSGWDNSTFIIVTTRKVECLQDVQAAKQMKVVLSLDDAGRLVVEQTVTYKHAVPPAFFVGARVIEGAEPQAVWVNRYERAKQ